MGAYIDLEDQSKEQWLSENGREISDVSGVAQDEMLVVLINNYAYTAAGIAFSPGETEEFLDKNDSRPKKLFAVKTDLLLDPEVSNLANYYRA